MEEFKYEVHIFFNMRFRSKPIQRRFRTFSDSISHATEVNRGTKSPVKVFYSDVQVAYVTAKGFVEIKIPEYEHSLLDMSARVINVTL